MRKDVQFASIDQVSNPIIGNTSKVLVIALILIALYYAGQKKK